MCWMVTASLPNARDARKEGCDLGCKHLFQHRLDGSEAFLPLLSLCKNQSCEGSSGVLFAEGLSEHVTCVEFSINACRFVVFNFQLLQPAVRAVQMFHSANSFLVAVRPRDVRICAGGLAGDPLHRTQYFIASIWLQQLAHAHYFAFSASECVLSSRPAVVVQPTTTHHQITIQMQISCRCRHLPSLVCL